MRVFSGIPLTLEAAAELARAVAPLWAGAWPVRWTAPDSWHVTLQFLGAQSAELAEAHAQDLGRAAHAFEPMALAIERIEAVPGGARARLVWAPVQAPPALELLQHEVVRAAGARGVEPEGRAFRPHLTLGRVRQGERLPRNAEDVLASLRPAVEWLADRAILYESRPAPAGAQYHALVTHRLGEGR